MIGSDEVLRSIGWGEGATLLKDLESLTTGEFAERWVPQPEPASENG